MKLSRPALASVAAIAIAAGSLTAANVVNAEDTSTLNDGTVAGPSAEAPADNPGDSDDAAGESPADEEPAGDEGANAPADNADAPAAPGTDSDAGETGVEGGADAGIQDVQAFASGLANQGNENVDPALAAAAQNVPDNDEAPAKLAAMRKMTSSADAPKQISGDPSAAQKWYNTKGVEGWYVHSESMNRDIPVALVRATDPDGNPVPDAPTLYMLNGAGGSEQSGDWIYVGDAQKVYAGKGVNLVIPMEGAFSYYVDWLTDGDTLKEKSRYFKGEQKWSTFLGKELWPAVEDELGANGKRGIVGFSMSGTSSLLLAEQHPDVYDAVGSFSGCAATSTPLPWAFAALTVNRAANEPNYRSITPAHIWGPMGSPYNRYNDALVNAEKLEGKALYISNGSGLASQSDMVGYRTEIGQTLPQAIGGSMTTTVEGGVIEAATNSCTHDLRAKLNSLNIPAHYEFRKAGTHQWPIWIDDLYRSWNTTFGPALVGDDFVNAEPGSDDLPLVERSTWNANGSS